MPRKNKPINPAQGELFKPGHQTIKPTDFDRIVATRKEKELREKAHRFYIRAPCDIEKVIKTYELFEKIYDYRLRKKAIEQDINDNNARMDEKQRQIIDNRTDAEFVRELREELEDLALRNSTLRLELERRNGLSEMEKRVLDLFNKMFEIPYFRLSFSQELVAHEKMLKDHPEYPQYRVSIGAIMEIYLSNILKSEHTHPTEKRAVQEIIASLKLLGLSFQIL